MQGETETAEDPTGVEFEAAGLANVRAWELEPR
jgi:hypothetical protein